MGIDYAHPVLLLSATANTYDTMVATLKQISFQQLSED